MLSRTARNSFVRTALLNRVPIQNFSRKSDSCKTARDDCDVSRTTNLYMEREGERYIVKELTYFQSGPSLYVFKNREELENEGANRVIEYLIAQEKR